MNSTSRRVPGIFCRERHDRARLHRAAAGSAKALGAQTPEQKTAYTAYDELDVVLPADVERRVKAYEPADRLCLRRDLIQTATEFLYHDR
jgi:hypothetical protein